MTELYNCCTRIKYWITGPAPSPIKIIDREGNATEPSKTYPSLTFKLQGPLLLHRKRTLHSKRADSIGWVGNYRDLFYWALIAFLTTLGGAAVLKRRQRCTPYLAPGWGVFTDPCLASCEP